MVTFLAIPSTVPDHADRYSITPTRLDLIVGDEHLDDRNIPAIDLKMPRRKTKELAKYVQLNANQERIREPRLQLFFPVSGAPDLFLVVSRASIPKDSTVSQRSVHSCGKSHQPFRSADAWKLVSAIHRLDGDGGAV